MRVRVGVIAGFAVLMAAGSPCLGAVGPAPGARGPHRAARAEMRPWVEGVDPSIENQLFEATYGTLESHNVLKVYAFSAGGYESAGIRFSGRVPHENRDLTAPELVEEGVQLIRTTFDDFPQIQHVDVWATVPVAQSMATAVENTVFSVSADRPVYEQIARRSDLSDYGFLNAFGSVWMAPQVPR